MIQATKKPLVKLIVTVLASVLLIVSGLFSENIKILIPFIIMAMALSLLCYYNYIKNKDAANDSITQIVNISLTCAGVIFFLTHLILAITYAAYMCSKGSVCSEAILFPLTGFIASILYFMCGVQVIKKKSAITHEEEVDSP